MPRWTKEQELAINEKGTNIIVSAGAGSGKTAVLSERVLTHLKNGVHIDELLILTFTNAAAAEMKQRIRKKIKDVEALKPELDKIDSAPITTFDAYSLSLVKKYSYLLNISSNISIIDGSIISIQKSHYLDDIFNAYYEAENPKFLKFIGDFSLKDDKTIKQNILKLNSKLDNLYNKDEYLNTYLQACFNEEKLNEYLKAYLDLINHKKDDIKYQVKNLSYYLDGKYITKLEESLINLLNAKTYDEIKKSLPDKIPPLPKGSEEEAKTLKKNLSETIKEISNLTKYENEQEIINTIVKTKDYISIIIDIILKLDEKINNYKEKENMYEFIDISRKAINLLETHPEVCETLKNKYYEILIDEYQDTNDLQELFTSYISKNNTYMVGDIKQSIYRFRNTNPELFKSKYEKYSKKNNGLKIDLNKNFRSRSNVLNDINQMFNQIMDTKIGGADYIESHQMIFGNTSYDSINKENYDLEILNYPLPEEKKYSNEEVEIFTIAKDIKDKINKKFEIMDPETNEPRPVTYSDFVILIDRATAFETYKKVFEYLNIPLTIYRDKAITSSLEITLLKNIYNLILKIKNHKYDAEFKHSFISLARSYLFEIDDNIIFTEISNRNYKESKIYQKCLSLLQNIEEKTNETLIYEIIEKFNFYEKSIKVGDIESHLSVLEAIIKIAQNCDCLGYTIENFYNYLTEVLETGLDIKLSFSKGESESVKIMTIHASKGLEFPICYYSGLSKNFNIDDLKSPFYFSSKYGFIVPYFNQSPQNTILKTLLKNEYIEDEISEKLRLFYVALTRAREKMIIVAHLNLESLSYKDSGIISDEIRLKYRSFLDFLNSIVHSLDKNITPVDLSKINLTKDYNLSSKSLNYQKPKITEKLNVQELNIESNLIENSHFSKTINKLETKEEKKNIEMGLHMHQIFENINLLNPDYSKLSEFSKNKVQAFINTGILNNALDTYKEYEFIYDDENEEKHGIIDLLITKENKNIIVDYKLKNISDEAYLKQLNGYKKYIESITNKQTEIYLYSILDETLQNITKVPN